MQFCFLFAHNTPLAPCDEFGNSLYAQSPRLRRCKPSCAKQSEEPTGLPMYGTVLEEPRPQRHTMTCTQSAYRKMTEHLASRPPEAAAMLVGPRDEPGLVTSVVPDLHGSSTPLSFRLDVKTLNAKLKDVKAAEMCCVGIVHSHPANLTAPSSGDLDYLRSLFELPQNDSTDPFLVPIFCGGRLYPYVYLDGSIHSAQLLLI